MPDWSRRDILKSGLVTSVGALIGAPDLSAGRDPGRPTSPDLPGNPPPLQDPSPRERLLLDFGWRFHLGHADDPAQDFGWGRGQMFSKTGSVFAPSRANFDDSPWRAVDLPHDWAVELPFENARELIEFGAKPLGRAYPATSIGWYRRTFDLPASDAGRRLSLEFDGVFRDCLVALNGHLLARNFSGYAPFRCDITDYANFGAKNVLVVRVDATGREGWFYEGAGIYRHVWLVKTNPVHVPQWGTFVTSRVDRDAATLAISTDVGNDGDADAAVRIVSTVLDPSGNRAGFTRSGTARVAPGDRTTVGQELAVRSPSLWSLETPHLYTLVTSVEVNGAEVDRCETPFGIRTLRFDADHGFFLNDRHVELKGTCNHQDHAGVGSALPDRLQSYRIERLKEMGCNAYRTSHNPPTSELLDACDRLGMLVLDETRFFGTQAEARSQLERMIRRDRNHPSIFCWSIGNEEGYVQGNDHGRRIAADMTQMAHALDPSRLTTLAMNGTWGRGGTFGVDVQGCNYYFDRIDGLHRQLPAKPIMGTEVASTVSTRGIYANDEARGYLSSYDVNAPPWGSTAEAWWTFFAAREYLAGGFVWTGFDYRGEPTPYRWPCINSHFGLMDTCGFPKDLFHYYQAWWGDKPVLHLFPHWNWGGREGQEVEVWCFTNVDRVELLVNGRSSGTQDVPRNGHVSWKVPYAPGAIEARGMHGGQAALTARRDTTGAPSQIALLPDRAGIAADGEDVVVVRVEIRDAEGRVVPTSNDEVVFTVSGPGRLLGVGNGDPSSHESDKGRTRRAFNGLCCAIVQAARTAGDIRVVAAADGLTSAAVTIGAGVTTPRPAVP